MNQKTSKILIIATIFMVFAIILFLSGCQKQSVGNIGLDDSSQIEKKCGLENCHGLELSCGPNAPEVCTEVYQLGDFCRQYASCQVVDGECQLDISAEFDLCKACVEDCQQMKACSLAGVDSNCDQPASTKEIFECENKTCREMLR